MTSDELLYQKPAHRIVGLGEYKNRRWAIISQGSHPCAYVQYDKDLYNDDNVKVNGGITFYDLCYWNEEDKRMYNGWDYIHCWDYYRYEDGYENNKGIKHTYEEIKKEIYDLIDYLELENE